ELTTFDYEVLEELLTKPDDRRFFAILELFRREVTIDRIHSITKIDPFFLKEMKKLITFEQKIENEWTFSTVTAEELLQIKQAGFTNRFLCEKWNCSEAALQERLLKFERSEEHTSELQSRFDLV